MPNAVTPSVLRIGFQVRVPRTGRPSMSSIRSFFTQRLQDDGIDARLVAHAVLEVRDSGPFVQGGIAGLSHSRLDLRGELAVEREPVLVRRDAEQSVVQAVQPLQLVDR